MSRSPTQDISRTLFNAELEDSLGFLIADTGRAVKRALYVRIAQHSIRGGHWYCLRSLFEQDGVTQRELSQRLGIMQPSTVEMLHAMEKEGLVRRERDTKDRRKVRIYLTEKAHNLEPVLQQILTEVRETMTRNMTAAEEVLLKLMLRRLREGLETDTASYAQSMTDAETAALDNDSESVTLIATKPTRGASNSPKT